MNSSQSRAYAKALGGNLRRVRQERGWSLADVEAKSDGAWKAVVVASYERADRQVTAVRLADLAEWYGVTVESLLPKQDITEDETPLVLLRRVVARLEAQEATA